MCNETTEVINMAEKLEKDQSTVMLGTDECTTQIQIEMLCKHGRTMCMMYQATKDNKYLKQARLDLERAKSLKEVGFIRPLGVLLNKVA